MEEPDRSDGAALSIWIWRDPEVPGWRARIRASTDLDRRTESTTYAASAADVLARVSEWLTAFSERGSEPPWPAT